MAIQMTAKERLLAKAAANKAEQDRLRASMPAADHGYMDRLQEEEKQRQAITNAERVRAQRSRTVEMPPVPKTPVSARAKKMAEIRADIDTAPVQGKGGKAAQSIGLNTMASVQYLGETAKQFKENTDAFMDTQEAEDYAAAVSEFNRVRKYAMEDSPEYIAAQRAMEQARARMEQASAEAQSKTVDPDSLGSRMMGESNRLKEEALEGTTGVTRFLGETGMSVASNVAKLPLGALAPVAMGAEAAAGKAYELQQQGVGAGRAMTRGITSGVIEGITEKMGLDNLFDLVKTGGKTAVKNVLKQAGVEGTEEGFSYVFNLLADKVAKDPNAQFNWDELLQSIASGAISGLFFGAAGTAANRGQALPDVIEQTGKEKQAPREGSLHLASDRIAGLPNAETALPNTENVLELPTRKTAEQLQREVENLERRLAEQETRMREASGDQRTVEEVVTERLRERLEEARAEHLDALSREGEAQSLPMVEERKDTEPQPLPSVENEKTAGQSQTVGNTRLNEADLEEYMKVGKTGHVKNAKIRLAEKGISPIMTTIGEVRQFIRDAILGKNKEQIRAYGKVGSKMADDVRDQNSNVNIDGYYLELESNHFFHLTKHVGEDKDPRNIPLTEEQSLELPEYIDTYDDVLEVKKIGDKTKVLLGKRINGHAVICEIVSTKRKSLHPETAYQIPTELYNERFGTKKVDVSSANTNQTSLVEDGLSGTSKYTVAQTEPTVKPDPVEPTGLPMKNEEQTVTPFTQEDYRKHYPSSPKASDVQERGPETEDEFLQSLTVEEPVAAETESAKEWIERNSGNWDTYVEIVGAQAQLIADERTDPTEKVKADRSQSRKTVRQKLGDTKREFLRKMVDSGDEIDRMGKAVKDSTLYAYYNQARAASNTAVRMITGKQSDVNGKTVGKGLNEIFQPIKQQGDDYYNAFQLYLYHRHNQDRMNRYDSTAVEAAQEAFQRYKAETRVLQPYSDVQIAQMAQEPWNNWQMEAQEYQRLLTELRKAENTRNKPVFGYDVTALDSEAAAEGLLREHPEFETMAQEVYRYVDNLMQYRVDSGLITAQDAAQLKQIYPHYVPTYRDIDTSGKARQKQRGVQVGKTIGRAEGGNEVLMPIHEALAKQTMSVVREGSKNRFGQRLMADATRNKEAVRSQVKNIQEAQSSFSVDDFDSDKDLLEDTKMTNTFVVREDGKRYEMEVSPEMYEGISVLSPEIKDTNEMVKIVRASNDLFKKLVTSYNPAFTVRNLVRDQQEAWVNSKDLAGYLKAYPEAIREITRGGQYWEQYQALGGVYASLFDSSTRMTTDQSTLEKATAPARKLIGRIEAINQAVEQAPRLAEFIATVKKGDGSMDNLMEAMYNAAEVTTNFGRSGTWGKFLNANFVPFLNPGVQGFDKMVRNFTETKGVVPWMKLAGKTAVLGIGAGVLNAILWGDDEEWDELKQRDKDVYYLFKIKDGLWAKIPKGRVMSVYGMVADRAGKAIRGEEVDLGEFIETAANQIAPANPLENNIASAWVGTKLFDRSDPGETWYGTDIESQRLQKYEPGERYDEDTDKVSKAIGQALNLSPKKINYLLNQYTGVVGDIVLPLLTPAAEKNFLVSNFTVDSVTSSKRNSDFYETMEDLEYAKNARAASGADQASYRWWNKVSSAVSEVNQAIRAIESNENLSDAEKLEQTRVQYAVRNALQAEAAASLETYKAAADKWYQQGEGMEESDRSDYAYLMANREIFGAEYALKTYNKSTYEKAQEANAEGLSYDDYFDGYFQMQNIEDAVEGSAARRAKYSEWVNERYTGETRQQMLGLFLTDSQMAKLEAAESAGVAAEIYMDFDTFYSEAKSDATSEKQEKVIKYINSLPVSSEQKTALYLVNYKESGLKKTPWYNSKQEIVGLPMLERAGNAEQFTMPVLELPSRESSGWEMPALMLP